MWRVSCGNSKDSEPPLIVPMSKKPSYLNTMFPSPTPPTAYHGLLKHYFPVANQHLSSGSERNKRGVIFNTEEVSMGAARWTPTPEQLYALEEIYQTGTRTPSAAQIQQIAARLRRFGKIEGKNVFYWFQNHKARERQKRRRQQLNNDLSHNEHDVHVIVPSLGLKTGYEVGQAKNWASPSDCSTISEESVVSLATAEVAQSEVKERIQFAETGLHLSIGTSIRQQLTEFSYTSRAVDSAQNHKKLLMPCRDMKNIEGERKYQTLELFPHWIGDHDDQYQLTDAPKIDNHSEVDTTNISSKFSPTNFFEFLPLKK